MNCEVVVDVDEDVSAVVDIRLPDVMVYVVAGVGVGVGLDVDVGVIRYVRVGQCFRLDAVGASAEAQSWLMSSGDETIGLSSESEFSLRWGFWCCRNWLPGGFTKYGRVGARMGLYK